MVNARETIGDADRNTLSQRCVLNPATDGGLTFYNLIHRNVPLARIPNEEVSAAARKSVGLRIEAMDSQVIRFIDPKKVPTRV